MEVGVVCTGVEVMAMGKMLVSFPLNATLVFHVWKYVKCVYMQCMYLAVPTCGCYLYEHVHTHVPVDMSIGMFM